MSASDNLAPGHFVISFDDEIRARISAGSARPSGRMGFENRGARKRDLVSCAGERWPTCCVLNGEAFADGVSPFTSGWH